MNPEEGFKRLREPFKPEQIGKLPRATKKDATKGNCRECGKWHGLPAVHLDYVGHAGVVDRLLEVDPTWTWEPLAYGPDGLPVIKNNAMWIKLTVLGVTRIGVGTVEGGKVEFEKQLISDALRNASMRFGVALDLWSKEDLSSDESATESSAKQTQPTNRKEYPVVEVASGDSKSISPAENYDDGGTGGGTNEPVPDAIPASEMDLILLRNRLSDFDEKFKKEVSSYWHKEWGSVKEGAKVPLSADQVAKVDEFLTRLEADQRDVRRKQANALMGEVGIKTDDARYEFIAMATGGETQSTARLNKEQIEAIKAEVAKLKAEDEGSAA